MRIIIQSPHFTVREELDSYVNEKVSKLSHLDDRIISADVCLKVEKSATDENKICEIRLAIPGNDLFAKRQSQTFEEATNEVVDVLQQQIKKAKGKLAF